MSDHQLDQSLTGIAGGFLLRAILVWGPIVLAAYLLVRFVKWAWTS